MYFFFSCHAKKKNLQAPKISFMIFNYDWQTVCEWHPLHWSLYQCNYFKIRQELLALTIILYCNRFFMMFYGFIFLAIKKKFHKHALVLAILVSSSGSNFTHWSLSDAEKCSRLFITFICNNSNNTKGLICSRTFLNCRPVSQFRDWTTLKHIIFEIPQQ